MLQEFGEMEHAVINAHGTVCTYDAGETIFSEGDRADFIYFINEGAISVYIDQFNTRAVIQTLEAGEWLGEMAQHNSNTRTASAETLAITRLLRVATEDFHALMECHPGIAAKINETLLQRSEELVLREKLLDLSGLTSNGCHIGIKGDPSLRESALTRERYESAVDMLMPQLLPVFKELLLHRSAFRLFIGCNNGEVRISTVFDPFAEEYHSAVRLVDKGYVERHFPKVEYAKKSEIMRNYYTMMVKRDEYVTLPEQLVKGYGKYYSGWSPVAPEVVADVIDSFPRLREIPNFYIRNATITTVKDVIHLQFNCDGTHILSAEGYKAFLEQNL